MFTKIEDIFWKDEKMRPASDDAKLLMLYLLTTSHRNIIGFYFLPLQYVAGDLNWDIERVSKGLRELLEMDRINYDETNSVILIKNFLKYNPLENSNQVKNAVKKLDELPKCTLFKDFERVLKGFNKPLYKPLLEQLGKQVEVEVYVEVKEEVIKEDEEDTRAREGKVFEFFNQNIGLISPYQSEVLSQYIDEGIEPEMIVAVMQDSLGKDDRWSWINRVLQNSITQNIRTLKQYNAKKVERENAKNRDKPKLRGEHNAGDKQRNPGNNSQPISGIGIEL